MVQRLTNKQKQKIKDMLRQGVETKAVAEFLGVSSRQVAAIAAHITMGSYAEEPTTFNDTYTIEDLSSKSKILINTIIQDENIIFHIVDQGIGVPLDFKEKIFDRFYTDRLKDKDKHTGLGLSISRKIIESFKGSINLIENHYEIYQGACFEIKLPLKG